MAGVEIFFDARGRRGAPIVALGFARPVVYKVGAMTACMLALIVFSSSIRDPEFLREIAETRRYMAGRPVNPVVTPDGKTVLFLRSLAKDARQRLYALDIASGRERELLTPQTVLQGTDETLTAEERARLERMRITARGFTSFAVAKDGVRVLLVLAGRLYVYDRTTGAVVRLQSGEGPCVDPKWSPDGTRVAYVRRQDLFFVELPGNRERAVTSGGNEVKTHGLAEFVAQEEMSRHSGYWFSPDGQTILYQETDHTGVEKFAIADPTRPAADPDRFYYPRAGRKNADVRLGIVSVHGGKTTWVHWDRREFPYLATVRWPAKGPLTLVVQNREQTREEVLAVDPRSGKTERLLREEDPAWINIEQKFPLWLEDGSGFFWWTERNGAPQVELRNADGSYRATWVDGDAGYVDMVGNDEATRTLYFTAGPSPVEWYVFKVREGDRPVRVGKPSLEPATEAGVLSGDGKLLLVTTTSLRAMPRTFVLQADGTALAELASVALEPKRELHMEIRRLAGKPAYWAAVLRPSSGAAAKFPVVLSVYGGPGHVEVRHSLRDHLLLQWLADQGFLVVKLDGRGTPHRGRDWERAIKGDFATSIVQDQVTGLERLAQEVPELDSTRVGAYGWSFGGYLAGLLALKEPERIKAAVAGAPVVDWHDYDSHYTERYLGLPDKDPKAYEVSSLLTYASRARRPLLLVHGTADDNVYFFHTLKLSDALFRAGKPHAVLPLSSSTHLVPDPIVTERLWERIATWFQETL